MERAERKRKRAVEDGGSGRRKTEEEENMNVQTTPQPTEDEVEELFAIWRRMHVVVKYFVKNNVGLEGRQRLTERLETEVLPVIDDEDDVVQEVGNGNVSNVFLDLNRMPEVEAESRSV